MSVTPRKSGFKRPSCHYSCLSYRVMEGFVNDVVSMDARYAWKYAASRAVTGTPQILVNGVLVQTSPSFSLSQWSAFITTLLDTPTAT